MNDQNGLLYLKLNCKGDTTYIEDCYATTPLKVAKALYLDNSGEAFIYIMNPSGGMVQADSYDININLAPKSKAFITTQSATKIYRMEKTGAYSKEHFYIGKNALLEYFPDPYIPFAGSRFKGETEIIIKEGATFFMAEILYPGRFKRGEKFFYAYFIKKIKIFYKNRLILYDNMVLKPEGRKFNSICLFENYPFYGQFICISEKINKDLSDNLHFLLKSCNSIKASSSLFHEKGVIVRVLGLNNLSISEALQKIWTATRNSLLNLPPVLVRKS